MKCFLFAIADGAATWVREQAGGDPYPEAHIKALTTIGFHHNQAVKALQITRGNVDAAANWLMTR